MQYKGCRQIFFLFPLSPATFSYTHGHLTASDSSRPASLFAAAKQSAVSRLQQFLSMIFYDFFQTGSHGKSSSNTWRGKTKNEHRAFPFASPTMVERIHACAKHTKSRTNFLSGLRLSVVAGNGSEKITAPAAENFPSWLYWRRRNACYNRSAIVDGFANHT